MTVRNIAKICHEANRYLCETQGDHTQLPWSQAPEWQRESAIKGVQYKLDNINATPEDQHEAWSRDKVTDGWRYGETKDAEAKTHPCLVPYSELDKGQQAKDHLFAGIVVSLKPFLL